MSRSFKAVFSGFSLSVHVALLGVLVSMTASAADPVLNLPPGQVNTSITFDTTLSMPSYFAVQFSGIVNGYDIHNSPQTYLSWCAQANAILTFPFPTNNVTTTTSPYTLFNTYPNSALLPTDQSPNWQKVNYILNHKNGHSVTDIQEAIWFLLDGAYHSNSFIGTFTGSPGADALLADAAANGTAFVPQPGQVVAVLLDGEMTSPLDGTVGPQDLIIEVSFGASTMLTTNTVTPGTTVEPNTTITVKVTETNTGNTTITNVSVAGGGACDSSSLGHGFQPANVPTLAPGASADFTCMFDAGNASGSWTAAATGTDLNGHPASTANESTSGNFIVIHPATTLTTKNVSPGSAVEPNTPITVTVTETNTGDSALTNVSVAWSGVTCTTATSTVASLAPNATADFSCTFNSGSASGTWSAQASATDAAGNLAPSTNESASGNFTVIHPATMLTFKSVSPGGTVEPNTPITVTVTEKNTGDSALTNVSVAWSGVTCTTATPTLASLAPNATADFSCTFNSGSASGSWTAQASATDAAGNLAPSTNESTSGNFTVIHPATTLTFKSVSPGATVELNTPITVTVTEKNTGDSALTNVSVAWSGVTCTTATSTLASLAPNATADFSCTFNSGSASGSWTAQASATDAGGNLAPSANESTSGSFTVIHPATTLTLKSATPGPVQVGSPVTVIVTETNTGDVQLTNVSVSGGGSCASFAPAGPITLLAHQSQDFTCTFTAALPSPMSWFADGHGTDSLGNAAPGTNEHQSGSVTVASPPLNICGLTWGFWKNHVSAWPVTTLVLGSQTYSQTELINILQMAVKGDASISLAHQLIAAKLNVANGTNPATANGNIDAADNLLKQFSGKLPYNVSGSSSVGQQMTTVEGGLDDFNSDGKLQPGCVFNNGGGGSPQPISAACAANTGSVGVFYSSSVVVSGGVGPYTFSVTSGSLPPGLSLNTSTGAISGTPTSAGTYPYSIKVVDSTGSAAGTTITNCSITINTPPPAPLKLACAANTGQVGVNYSSALVASGGVPGYTYSISSGSLPPGLTLNPSSGVISGIPTGSGGFNFTGKVTDSSGSQSNTATNQCGIQVAPPSNTNVCGVTWGYWKNHTNNWGAGSLTLGNQTYLKSELITLLQTAVKGDASIDLAHQLIAAKLNVLNGTNIATAGTNIATADFLLGMFSGKLGYNVSPSSGTGVLMTTTASNLDDFNSDGKLQPGCVMPQ